MEIWYACQSNKIFCLSRVRTNGHPPEISCSLRHAHPQYRALHGCSALTYDFVALPLFPAKGEKAWEVPEGIRIVNNGPKTCTGHQGCQRDRVPSPTSFTDDHATSRPKLCKYDLYAESARLLFLARTPSKQQLPVFQQEERGSVSRNRRFLVFLSSKTVEV